MKMMMVDTYSRKLKKGEFVEVDNIKWFAKSGSGIMLRVIGVWKKPQWFDLNWFVVPTPDAQPKEREG